MTLLNVQNSSNMEFTLELPVSDKIPFIGIEIVKSGTRLETQVYRKPTNPGLLVQFHSHTDKPYKDSLLKTMLHCAAEAFNLECDK